ncbi:MAG: DUF1016 N-terminal domain-containing protein [Flavonifractor plautii]
MREFYRAYADNPELLALALKLGWTQNAAILEECEDSRERAWYLRAALERSLDQGRAVGAGPGRSLAAIHTRRTAGFLLY